MKRASPEQHEVPHRENFTERSNFGALRSFDTFLPDISQRLLLLNEERQLASSRIDTKAPYKGKGHSKECPVSSFELEPVRALESVAKSKKHVTRYPSALLFAARISGRAEDTGLHTHTCVSAGVRVHTRDRIIPLRCGIVTAVVKFRARARERVYADRLPRITST